MLVQPPALTLAGTHKAVNSLIPVGQLLPCPELPNKLDPVILYIHLGIVWVTFYQQPNILDSLRECFNKPIDHILKSFPTPTCGSSSRCPEHVNILLQRCFIRENRCVDSHRNL